MWIYGCDYGGEYRVDNCTCGYRDGLNIGSVTVNADILIG